MYATRKDWDEQRAEGTGIRRVGAALVFDRTTFFERFESEIAQSWCVSIVVVEIDDIARIDGEGEWAAGDAVMQEVTLLARALLRPRDIVARMARAELAFVLGGVALGEGRAYTDRLRASIAALEVASGERHFRVTSSAGVASSIEGIRDARALYYRADNRLQAAKERVSAG